MKNKLKIVYLGTPDFAVKPFLKLLSAKDEFEILAVVTNTDRPVGRKQIITAPPVKLAAKENNIPVLQYDKIKIEGVDDLKSLNPDILITCAFGQILSQEIIDIPKYGILNIHASLLPKYRGASPINYAIANGEKETGVTIMRTDAGIDTGDILTQKSIKIGEKENVSELSERLSELGADMIVEALRLVVNGKAEFKKQDDSLATHTKLIKKEDLKIDFNKSATEVANFVRAFSPVPAAYCLLNGETIKIYSCSVSNEKVGASESVGAEKNVHGGEIIRDDKVLEVACGQGSVLIEELQKSGGKILSVKAFLSGARNLKGEILN